ncbi:MAG: transglutaminase domain-containing protein [Huintestinicola sp.]
MKLKRLIAASAAILMVCSVFAACGKNSGDSEGDPDISINVISDGTAAEGPVIPPVDEDSDPERSEQETQAFSDPGAALATSINEEYDVTIAPETLSPDAISSLMETTVTTERKPVIADYNVDCTTRYGYNQLNDAEKKLYKDILDAVQELRLKVPLDDSVTDEMWLKVYGCVYTQEPQLFWMTHKTFQKGKLKYREVDRDLIASMQNEINTAAGTLVASVNGKSDYEKLKAFHDYIATSNNFQVEMGYNQTIYGGLVLGSLQCEGYAKTMQYLCDLAGIESCVVYGSNKDGDSHAWNVVKADGKWYNLDTTWDDPILTVVDEKNVRYNYFLVPDEWIHEKSHFNINMKISGTQIKFFDPPACTSDDLNYFKKEGKLFSDKASADSALRDEMKKAAANKSRVAEIRVTTKAVYDEITANLKDYANWIKEQDKSVTKVTSNCDSNTLVIELDLLY